jgi:NAD(P)-dependent dehydrogenase (short-subunit alcohol dehydrogenase family)
MSPTPPARPVVVITGASSGIGAALATRLAPTHHLVLSARRAEPLRALASTLGAPDVVTVAADVTVRQEVDDVVDTALARFSRLDVWVNNVGRGITRAPSALTDADVDDMMRVNVKSALYGMQAVLPHFRLVGRGHVINVSSMLGRVPTATFRSAYSASKHFLNALTATLRTEVQETHPAIQFSPAWYAPPSAATPCTAARTRTRSPTHKAPRRWRRSSRRSSPIADRMCTPGRGWRRWSAATCAGWPPIPDHSGDADYLRE